MSCSPAQQASASKLPSPRKKPFPGRVGFSAPDALPKIRKLPDALKFIQDGVLHRFDPFGLPMFIDRHDGLALCTAKEEFDEDDKRWMTETGIKSRLAARPDYFHLSPKPYREAAFAFPGFNRFFEVHVAEVLLPDNFYQHVDSIHWLRTFYDAEVAILGESMQRLDIIQLAIRCLLLPFMRWGVFHLFRDSFEFDSEKRSAFFEKSRDDKIRMRKAEFWLIICHHKSHYFLAVYGKEQHKVWVLDSLASSPPSLYGKLLCDYIEPVAERRPDPVDVDLRNQPNCWSCWLMTMESARGFLYETDFRAKDLKVFGYQDLQSNRGRKSTAFEVTAERWRMMFRNAIGQEVNRELFPYSVRPLRRLLDVGPATASYFDYRLDQIREKRSVPLAPWEGNFKGEVIDEASPREENEGHEAWRAQGINLPMGHKKPETRSAKPPQSIKSTQQRKEDGREKLRTGQPAGPNMKPPTRTNPAATGTLTEPPSRPKPSLETPKKAPNTPGLCSSWTGSPFTSDPVKTPARATGKCHVGNPSLRGSQQATATPTPMSGPVTEERMMTRPKSPSHGARLTSSGELSPGPVRGRPAPRIGPANFTTPRQPLRTSRPAEKVTSQQSMAIPARQSGTPVGPSSIEKPAKLNRRLDSAATRSLAGDNAGHPRILKNNSGSKTIESANSVIATRSTTRHRVRDQVQTGEANRVSGTKTGPEMPAFEHGDSPTRHLSPEHLHDFTTWPIQDRSEPNVDSTRQYIGQDSKEWEWIGYEGYEDEFLERKERNDQEESEEKEKYDRAMEKKGRARRAKKT